MPHSQFVLILTDLCLSTYMYLLWQRLFVTVHAYHHPSYANFLNAVLKKKKTILQRACVNVIYRHSKSLLFAATQCPSLFIHTVFRDSSLYSFSFCGYTTMFGSRHIKQYYPQISFVLLRLDHGIDQLLAPTLILNRLSEPFLVTSIAK